MRDDARLQATMGMLLVETARAHKLRIGSGLARLGLHLGQELLLSQLWECDAMPQSELVARLGVERPTVTKMLSRMSRAGLVRRKRDPNDGRVWLIMATPKAEALRTRVEGLWLDIEEALLRGIDSSERNSAARVLKRMRDNLRHP